MCVGIPMEVVSASGSVAHCRGRLGLRAVDVSLVAPVKPGEWLLTWLDSARSRLEPGEAAKIDRALDALEAIGRGEAADIADYFPDLVGREPQLPEFLREKS